MVFDFVSDYGWFSRCTFISIAAKGEKSPRQLCVASAIGSFLSPRKKTQTTPIMPPHWFELSLFFRHSHLICDSLIFIYVHIIFFILQNISLIYRCESIKKSLALLVNVGAFYPYFMYISILYFFLSFLKKPDTMP